MILLFIYLIGYRHDLIFESVKMISVFVPSHITGFFSILDNENPLIKGSLGAGVLLDKGVVTEISKSSRENDNNSNHPFILINGKVDDYN